MYHCESHHCTILSNMCTLMVPSFSFLVCSMFKNKLWSEQCEKTYSPKKTPIKVFYKHNFKHLQIKKEKCRRRHVLSLDENFPNVEIPLSISLSNPLALAHLHVGNYPTMLPHIHFPLSYSIGGTPYSICASSCLHVTNEAAPSHSIFKICNKLIFMLQPINIVLFCAFNVRTITTFSKKMSWNNNEFTTTP